MLSNRRKELTVSTVPVQSSNAAAIKAYSEAVYDAFMTMRDTISDLGPLPPYMCEIIRCSHFAAQGVEHGFMVHGARALELGGTPDDLRHAVVVALGNNTIFARVGAGLRWVDELERQRQATSAGGEQHNA
jgi:hypothetical protein